MKYYKILSIFDNAPIIWIGINKEKHYTVHISESEISKISVIANFDSNWVPSNKDEFLAAAKVAMSNLQNILSNE